MKKLLLLILFTTSIFAQQTETVCVYDIVYPEFWDSTTTITTESQGNINGETFGHYNTYFIDGVAQFETRDGVTRMIYHFYEHLTNEHIFFYSGINNMTTSSTRIYCYERVVLSNEDVTINDIKIYPNPTNGMVNLEGLIDFEVIIYSTLGVELRRYD